MFTNQPLAVRFASPFQLLDAFLTDHLPEVFPGHLAPATNIAETDDAFVLSFEMPGVEERDIQLTMHERQLTVSAERKEEQKQEGTTWHRVEQRTGQWSRTIALPEAANADAVEATYRRGVLEVRVPKHPKSKPVRVQIKAD